MHANLAPHPPTRQTSFPTIPNRGPPPRHLIPATLKPSPKVKLHPADVFINMQIRKGKATKKIFLLGLKTVWKVEFLLENQNLFGGSSCFFLITLWPMGSYILGCFETSSEYQMT